MEDDQHAPGQRIEVRGFKWPRRPTAVAAASFLGRDRHGRWLGIAQGDPWRAADGSRSGRFERSFVKLVPDGTFWTACFHPADPVVDVDIVLPVDWSGTVLEEVDLEIDIVRSAAGLTAVRDLEEFERVRRRWPMPGATAAAAWRAAGELRLLVERRAEPFGAVGPAWLARFLGRG